MSPGASQAYLSSVDAEDIMPVLLLLLFFGLLAIIASVIVFVLRQAARERAQGQARIKFSPAANLEEGDGSLTVRRPACWLAIKSRNLRTVETALGLHHVKPCSMFEGLGGEQPVFVAPPVNGWVLVTGSDLPDPAEDVDACFRFLIGLSRKLGQVQLFTANSALGYHSWVRAEKGRISRAYSWAGKALWNQGQPTPAEQELGVRCFEYADPNDIALEVADFVQANVEKVAQLAAKWSLDPGRITLKASCSAGGIAGKVSHRF